MVSTYGGATWGDFVFQADVKQVKKGKYGYASYIIFRATPDFVAHSGGVKRDSRGSGYAFGVDDGNAISSGPCFCVYKIHNGKLTTLTPGIWRRGISNNISGWNTLKVEAQGNLLKFYLNNMTTPVWTYTDNTGPILSGRIGLLGYTDRFSNTTHYFDNVAVIGTPLSLAKVQLIGSHDVSNKFVFKNTIISSNADSISAKVELTNSSGCWYVAIPNTSQTQCGAPLSKSDIFLVKPHGRITLIDNALAFSRGEYYQLDITRNYRFGSLLAATDLIMRGVYSQKLVDSILFDYVNIETGQGEEFYFLLQLMAALYNNTYTSFFTDHLDAGNAYLEKGDYLNATQEFLKFFKFMADYLGRDLMAQLFTATVGSGWETVWDNDLATLMNLVSDPSKQNLFQEIVQDYATNPGPIEGYVRYECR
jgi:hypothetical protein